MQKNNSLVKAINKNVRTSPRKLSLVCNFIKGKKADLALRDLEFSRKRIAQDVSKTVKSAISNAENNHQFDIDNLFIKEAYVGKSLVMKRFRPRAKGRASPIKKPFSRITIVLEEKKSKKETRNDIFMGGGVVVGRGGGLGLALVIVHSPTSDVPVQSKSKSSQVPTLHTNTK